MSIKEIIAQLYKTWMSEIGIPNGTLGCAISPEKMLLELINKEKISGGNIP